jgi:hypothetical protein
LRGEGEAEAEKDGRAVKCRDAAWLSGDTQIWRFADTRFHAIAGRHMSVYNSGSYNTGSCGRVISGNVRTGDSGSLHMTIAFYWTFGSRDDSSGGK